MSDHDLYIGWFLGLGLVAIVVLIAATLLFAILLTGRGILRHAREGLAVAERIENDTRVIWDLVQTNEVAAEILASATTIETRGGVLVKTLEEPRAVVG